MAFDVHIHVAFECWAKTRLERLARQHLKLLQADDARNKGAPPECELFLEYITEGHSVTGSRKGELCTWGCVANYTSAGAFIKMLRPFWLDLFSEVKEDGEMTAVLPDFCRIIVFQENEQSEAASAFQISFEKGSAGLVVKEFHRLPFSWGQA